MNKLLLQEKQVISLNTGVLQFVLVWYIIFAIDHLKYVVP